MMIPIQPEFYQRVSKLRASLVDYIKENGPYCLGYSPSKFREFRSYDLQEIILQEIIKTEMGVDDCEIEVTNRTITIELYPGDEWDTAIRITLAFYEEFENLFIPLIELNLQEFWDNLKKSLMPILLNFDREEYTDRSLEDAINQVLDKATMWIKFDGYQLEWSRKNKSIKVHLSDRSVQISLNLF